MTREIAARSQYAEPLPLTSSNEARRTVSCVICGAVYTPAQAYEYLALTSAMALESALMSMSHFCFRCRRPSCPQCWDEIHGVCGACVQDAHLPFRRASTPLKGALFVAAPQTQGQSAHRRFPLVCIHHGRFQRPAGAVRKPTIVPVKTRRAATSPGAPTEHKVAPAVGGRPTRELPPMLQDDIAEKDTQPIHHEAAAHLETSVARPEELIELDTRPIFQRSIWSRIELLMTVCVSVLLLLLLITILLSLVFPAVNMLVASVLHIDIEAEIKYLLQLIMHLH